MKMTMKKLARSIGLGAGLLGMAGAPAAWAQETNVVEVPAQVRKVFVPKGFDSNDNALVVVEGAYPNSCYKMGPTRVQVDNERHEVSVEVSAYYTTRSYCLMLYIPFTQTVNIGVLPAADYKLTINSKESEILPVMTAANSQTDDYLYATISSLSRRAPRSFLIQGVLPSSCAALSEIRVIKEAGNVVTVLPIVKIAGGCQPDNEPQDLAFETEFEVPADVQGENLLQVRSLNGASINQVVTF
jgi:hypothetical protein